MNAETLFVEYNFSRAKNKLDTIFGLTTVSHIDFPHSFNGHYYRPRQVDGPDRVESDSHHRHNLQPRDTNRNLPLLLNPSGGFNYNYNPSSRESGRTVRKYKFERCLDDNRPSKWLFFYFLFFFIFRCNLCIQQEITNSPSS